MASLVVSFPDRPNEFAKSNRYKYRVLLDNGRELRLPELAQLLKIPYPTLAKYVHAECATIGTHTDNFIAIIARIKKNAASRPREKQDVCPHCQGSGRSVSPDHAAQ